MRPTNRANVLSRPINYVTGRPYMSLGRQTVTVGLIGLSCIALRTVASTSQKFKIAGKLMLFLEMKQCSFSVRRLSQRRGGATDLELWGTFYKLASEASQKKFFVPHTL